MIFVCNASDSSARDAIFGLVKAFDACIVRPVEGFLSMKYIYEYKVNRDQ